MQWYRIFGKMAFALELSSSEPDVNEAEKLLGYDYVRLVRGLGGGELHGLTT